MHGASGRTPGRHSRLLLLNTTFQALYQYSVSLVRHVSRVRIPLSSCHGLIFRNDVLRLKTQHLMFGGSRSSRSAPLVGAKEDETSNNHGCSNRPRIILPGQMPKDFDSLAVSQASAATADSAIKGGPTPPPPPPIQGGPMPPPPPPRKLNFFESWLENFNQVVPTYLVCNVCKSCRFSSPCMNRKGQEVQHTTGNAIRQDAPNRSLHFGPGWA